MKIYKKEKPHMCQQIKKYNGKSPEELLDSYASPNDYAIDIKALCRAMKIPLIETSFIDLEKELKLKRKIRGMSFANEHIVGIFYSSEDSPHRQKFTIAHEIAHICLHMKPTDKTHIEFRRDVEEIKNIPEKEREANIFAGKLLIPHEKLKYVISKLYLPTIANVAEIFDVSKQVMKERLVYLGINLPEK